MPNDKALGTNETGNFGCTSRDRKYICTLPKGHESAMHEAHGAQGIILHSWPVQPPGEPQQFGPIQLDTNRAGHIFISQDDKESPCGTRVILTPKQSVEVCQFISKHFERVAASSKEATPAREHICEAELFERGPSDGYAKDGERWTCSCGKIYEHSCEEANGCQWNLCAEATPSPATKDHGKTADHCTCSCHDEKERCEECCDGAGARSVVVAPQTENCGKPVQSSGLPSPSPCKLKPGHIGSCDPWKYTNVAGVAALPSEEETKEKP